MLLFLLVFVGIFGVKSLAAENYIPGNVAKLTVTARAENSVSLRWTKVNNADGYIVYMIDKKNNTYTNLTHQAGTSYTVKNLKLGQRYYFQVFAYNYRAGKVYKSVNGSPIVIATTAYQKPRQVKNLRIASYGDKSMVRKHFMKLVPPRDHKFAALHGAVWSGGSFVYVPPGVSVEIPLQSYFRLNAPGAGQFEHTLIIVDEGAYLHFIEGCSAPKYNVANLHAGCVELYVGKNATLRYSTIENWSKNMYNLNTKRAKVAEGGKIEWVSGSFGSHVSYLYPMSLLNGEGARAEFTGITFAGKGQNLDTGAKIVHNAPNTSSYMNTRSISKDGGISTFRSAVVVNPKAKGSKSAVSCQSLMLDDISRSDTIPAMDIRTNDADVGHEAKIGRISDEALFYLMSRGISEEEARALIVSGFADNVSKELPLEYAVEMNNLIRLEMKGSIG